MKKFPVFDKFTQAKCWKCGRVIDASPKPSGFCAGRGEFTKWCKVCETLTFFDVGPDALKGE